MPSADVRRADADDAIVRAEMARTKLEQARERLATRKLELERRREARQTDQATRPLRTT